MTASRRVSQLVCNERQPEFIDGVILSNREVARDIHLIEIEPDLTGKPPLKEQADSTVSGPARSEEIDSCLPAKPYPGQFYHFLSGENEAYERLLRRPLSVLDASSQGLEGFNNCAKRDSTGFRLYFLVEVAGSGTRWICALEEGLRVDMFGPLGRGFPFFEFERSKDSSSLKKKSDLLGSCSDGEGHEIAGDREEQRVKGGYTYGLKRVLLVSGGMGLVPVFYAARELERLKLDYSLIAGFKSGDKLFTGVHLLEGDVRIYTEDGTFGVKGMASDGFSDVDISGYSAVFVCGPTAMMRKASDMARAHGIPCYISLTARMGCGAGFCGCCVVTGAKGNLRVCSEGPVFLSRDFFPEN